ncbi:hypothetical protein FACS189454_04350 [Planctomycetales bacterium]|nr:hypothetical protein FACS189454_04350 [Planctomycetales bacterium]
MYLYRMLADLGIGEITDPDAPLIKVPAYKTFVDSLPRFYGMFHRKPVKDKPVYDFVLHLLAYLHAKKHPDFVDAAAVNGTFRIFQREKKNAKGRIELWTPVLQAMQSIFDEEFYGWNPAVNQYRDFWSTEVKFAHEHGFALRKDLFYSYFTKLKLVNETENELSPPLPAEKRFKRATMTPEEFNRRYGIHPPKKFY